MRAEQITERVALPSITELDVLAKKFIKSQLRRSPTPSWLNENGGYNWNMAASAHLNDLPLSNLQKFNPNFKSLLFKIHYKLWLEYEDERLKNAINSMEKRRARIRDKLLTTNTYRNT